MNGYPENDYDEPDHSLPNPEEILRTSPERLPPWLMDYRPGDRFHRRAFFSSRVVFYPGSGTDGQPVKLFGSTHAAHCFIYADYGVSASRIREQLSETSPHRFRGYRVHGMIDVAEGELTPRRWTRHLSSEETARSDQFSTGFTSPFALLAVLEREPGFDDDHGSQRLAVLFLGADGIATYDALWCQDRCPLPPYCCVVQDHGFGGNYTSFGRRGLLELLAIRRRTWPELLLVATGNSKPWADYEPYSRPGGADGGMHGFTRRLWRKSAL